MNRRLERLQAKMGLSYQILVGLVLALWLLLLGYSSVQPRTYNFALNRVADITVRAPKTVEDTERTEELRQHARSRVSDVRLYSPEVKNQQVDLLNQYFSFVKGVRQKDYRASDLESAARAQGWSDNDLETLKASFTSNSQRLYWTQLTEAERLLLYNQSLKQGSVALMSLNESLPDNARNLWLSLDDKQFETMSTYMVDLLSQTLSQEIEPANTAANLSKLRASLREAGQYSQYQSALVDFIQPFIVPTLVYNQEETNRLKEEAAAAVQPAYILQGQIIVQEGHVIDSTVLRQLKLFGYLDASVGRYNAYIFYALIIAHFLLLLGLNTEGFRFKQAPSAKRQMAMTIYALAFGGLFAVLKALEVLQVGGFAWATLLLPISLWPLLVVPKTSMRDGLIGLVSFNVMALFVLSDVFNILESLMPLVFYCFTGLIGMILVNAKVWLGRKRRFVPAYIGLQLLTILPLLLGFNMDLTTFQGRRMAGLMLANILMTVIFYLSLSPYWERIFNPSAELSLQQLANLNHPLLKDLIEKAPGTYHHSMMVANLSANAVEAIGGDSLLTRVASYYHDVGKTLHPLFFVENLPAGVENPHKMIKPIESAQIITGHVTAGVKIMEAHNLPTSIQDICWQHHGTTLVKYFYYQAQQEGHPVDQADFRYPGPKPRTKEAAVIMIADSVEAASRTLKEYSQASIEGLVGGIIQGKVADDQFSDCDLTVNELKIVQATLIRGVASMYHTRIEYPK